MTAPLLIALWLIGTVAGLIWLGVAFRKQFTKEDQ